VDSNFDVYVVPAEGGATRNLTSDNPGGDGGPRYSPDGRLIAFGRQLVKGFYADKTRLVLHDRAARTNRVMTEAWDRSLERWPGPRTRRRCWARSTTRATAACTAWTPPRARRRR